MSISQRDSKAVIYGEVERLRELLEQRDREIALLTEQLARRVRRAVNRPNDADQKALNAFIKRYCAKFGVNTVPGHIVKEFKRRRANEQG